MRWHIIFFTAAVAFIVLPSRVANSATYNIKVYNAETKSYFELVPIPKNKKNRSWESAYRMASKRLFKDVRGRLAVVKSSETNEFLRRNFEPNLYTWIGLRIWCVNFKMQWTTGEIHSRKGYQNWDRRWNQSGAGGCRIGTPGNKGIEGYYLVVAYTPVDLGFRWVAKAGSKNYGAMLVEYPTGGE